MDIDDPIQQFLKNTGWSCEDLLEKLQKYKSQNTEDTSKSAGKNSTNPEECVVDSTGEISKYDVPKIQNLEPKEKVHKEVYKEKTDVISNDHLGSKEFSDTDEEECEVNVTNSNIINEIIDEIYSGETEQSRDRNENIDYQTEENRDDEATEVTEVRVIEMNTDDEEDDCFVEEGSENITNSNELVNSNNIEYLETHPRNIPTVLNQPLLNELNYDEENVTEKKSVEFSQENEKQKTLITNEHYNLKESIEFSQENKKQKTLVTNERQDLKESAEFSQKNNKQRRLSTNESYNLKPCDEFSLERQENSKQRTLNTNESYNIKESTDFSQDNNKPKSLITNDYRNLKASVKFSQENNKQRTISTNKNYNVNESIEFNQEINKLKSLITNECQSVEFNQENNKQKPLFTNHNSKLNETNKHETEFKEHDKSVAIVDKRSESKCEKSDSTLEVKLINEKTIDSLELGVKANNKTHDEYVEKESTSDNLEDIRNNLKLQLNCLRTRKKGHFLQELRNKVSDVEYNKTIVNNSENEDIVTSVNKGCKSNEIEKRGLENKVICSNENSVITVNDNLNDELYTQTNEFGLVILNVRGGVYLDEFEDETCKNNVPEGNLNESSSNTNNFVLDTTTDFNNSNSFSQNNTENNEGEIETNVGVLDEIRKIIRKQKENTFKKNKKTEVVFDNKIDKPKEGINNFGFFSGSLEFDTAKEMAKKYEKSGNPVSAENSSSSFTTEDTIQATDKNSPFISNTLDEFLTENSKLNISYNVPKCGAEEGLSENYHEESPLLLKKIVKVDKEQLPKPENQKIIKAKTLAQKRKMLEKQRLKQLKTLKPTLPKYLVSHDIKLYSSNVTKEKKDSFVLMNNKKIWVKSTRPATCIAKINFKPASNKTEALSRNNQPQRKLSLLTDLGKKIKEQIKYRPGPMCKKADLQVSGQDNWKTEMKTLPKILLEVTPRIGKPIPSHILSRLPRYDGKLTGNQIEFALSMLKTKPNNDIEPKTFTFPITYKKNQERIFVRKRNVSPIKCVTTKLFTEQKNDNSVVADIIDDLIRYIEIKEIAPSLIKEDEKIQDTIADDKFAKMPAIADNVSSILKKPQKKKSKVELELSRLSCKVVNVEVEENLTAEICSKPYCQLGCVCRSLKCDRVVTYHCGKMQCMMECKCPKERAVVYDKVMLPAGTDILSTDAVNRIEDEAKRDLAKVEREFTQTVIHTSDKTIVVGLGGRNKSKRTTKTPKKYTDFVDNFGSVKEERKEINIAKNDFYEKCSVSLEKLNLSGIIPYCLTHQLYNCHCKGKSLYKSDIISTKPEAANIPSKPIISEDEEDVMVKKQTNNPKTYNNKNKSSKLKQAKEQKQTYNPQNTYKNKPPQLNNEESYNELDVEEKIKKKQTYIPKKCKNKSPELKPAKEHKQFYSELDIEEIIGTKQTYNPKDSQVKPAKKQEKSNNLNSINSHTEKIVDEVGLISTNGRPIRNIRKVKLKKHFSYSPEVSFYSAEDCARVRGIPKHVLSNYKDGIKDRNHFLKRDFINNITEADLLKSKLNYDTTQMLEVDLLKKHLISESKRQKEAISLLVESTYSEKYKHRRKQTLEVRNDNNNAKISFNQHLAIQRRKKLGFITRKNTSIESVFDGEIIIDNRNMELLQKIGPKTVADGYARLLPWKALSESFRNGTIKIWSMVDMPSRLLINKSDRLPPKNYINITQTAQPGEVIQWILNNKLPSNYHEDNVSFILKQTKDHYEICGLCTKNFNEEVTSEATLKSGSENEITMESIEENLVPFPHKDLDGVSQLLYIKKDRFKLQELIEENLAAVGETSVDKNRLYMWAALPAIDIRVSKWRIIFLNSDFSYLYFTNLKYSIKYTDLFGLSNIAKTENCTVMLRNPLIQQAYKHDSFGIYFDAHYQDRLFIGPYSKEFNGRDLETLRYINKSLVCNESFYKMQGKIGYKCGHWLIERPYDGSRHNQDQTIDLTNDSCQTVGKRKRDSDTDENSKKPKCIKYKVNDHAVIMHKKEQIQVVDGRPRKPEEFNRYIITNIPHFGYLGAYKRENSNKIDISWPFENKLLRFSTVASAIDFLQDRFSSLLQPIPETFKINVIVLTQIDLENSNPINASILSGHYICGEFGYYNVKTISDELCVSALNMRREELLRIFAKRAQAFVRKKVEELSDLLNIDRSELGRYDIINILEMAQKEVNVQKEIEKYNMTKKSDLLSQRRDLSTKTFCMISTLPAQQKRIEYLKFVNILGKNSVASVIHPEDKTEPIVIPDSDEEEISNSDDKESVHYKESTKMSENGNMDVDFKEPSATPPSTPETVQVQSASGPMVSLLVNKNVSNKVTETTTALPPQRKCKLKSVLKPVSNAPTTSSSVEPSSSLSKEPNSSLTESDANQKVPNLSPKTQYLKGVKIIKTTSGKLMLVSDKDVSKPFRFPDVVKGTKIVIKNSKILSIKSIETNDKGCEQGVTVSETATSDENNISTQVCYRDNENLVASKNISYIDPNKSIKKKSRDRIQ